jgi:fructuronate reductase
MNQQNRQPRLSLASLATSRPAVRRPSYAPAALRPGIVHLGIGAFVRGHVAIYTEDAIALRGGDWGIVGVSLRHPDQRDRLAPQDGLYTALERGPVAKPPRIVGCLREVLVAPENPEVVLGRMTGPAIRIVSLTVTEKGYGHDPATGRLNPEHDDIRHDIAEPHAPRSAVGFIVEALARRRAAGVAPFTVMSCDNLPQNGKLLKGLVRDFAARRDPELAHWIDTHGAFPSSMVDRVVPPVTDADRADIENLTGLFDASPVGHEPFSQWVLEDSFVGGARPAWHECGVEFADDVKPYEDMKLQLLNGAHSALAYLGYLSGHDMISQAIADPVLQGFVRNLWDEEVIPVVHAPAGVDLAAYTATVQSRFANPFVRHRTWQVAMDGSQKLPQRILPSVRARLARGMDLPRLALVIAAWVRYAGGTDEGGKTIDVRDPLAGQLRDRLGAASRTPADQVEAALSFKTIFGDDLPTDERFRDALRTAYAELALLGARKAAASLAGHATSLNTAIGKDAR